MASSLTRIGDLDIHQDLAFQHRSWTVQRLGWIIMTLAVIAGLLGLFGQGPLSSTTTDESSLPFRFEYDRLARSQSSQIARLHLQPGASSNGRFSLWLSNEYVARVRIGRMTPEPVGARLSPGGLTYDFLVDASDHGGQIVLHFEVPKPGLLSGRIGLAPSPSIAFSQWIYP